MFRSNLRAIQLLAVAKTSDIRTYGCKPLLEPFVEQMQRIGKVHGKLRYNIYGQY